MFFGKLMCSEGIDKQGTLCMRDVMLCEHISRLTLGPTGFSHVQRIVVAAASHEFFTDPAINQRFQGFHDAVTVSSVGTGQAKEELLKAGISILGSQVLAVPATEDRGIYLPSSAELSDSLPESCTMPAVCFFLP